MITDTLENLDRYRGLHSNLDKAIEFLNNTDLEKLPIGKTVVEGSHVFMNVMEAELRNANGAGFEYHKKYADLQVDISGSEYWEYAITGVRQGEFDAGTDFGLVDGTACSAGTLGEGRFVLFLPEEFHKPSCINETCTHVRKIVVKIEM